jgi:hypothetical protein
MTLKTVAVVGLTVLALAGCTTNERPVSRVVLADDPHEVIVAPNARIRAAIAQRAVERGVAVTLNDAKRVVLERDLAQTPPALEASCGGHQAGRKIRVELTIEDGPGATLVTERRFVVDKGDVCPVRLVQADIAQAQQDLAELKRSAERK